MDPVQPDDRRFFIQMSEQDATLDQWVLKYPSKTGLVVYLAYEK